MEIRVLEKTARKKAEKAAMQEAMVSNIMIWFPLFFIAFVMMLGGAPSIFSVLFIALALVAGAIGAMVTWKTAYKRYYEKYLAEVSALKTEGVRNEE